MELNDGSISAIEKKKILVVHTGNYFWRFSDDMLSEKKVIYSIL